MNNATLKKSKPAKLGSVNAAFLSTLSDIDGKYVGSTMHTPNAVAHAMAGDDRIQAAHSGFLDSTYTRDGLAANIKASLAGHDCPSLGTHWKQA